MAAIVTSPFHLHCSEFPHSDEFSSPSSPPHQTKGDKRDSEAPCWCPFNVLLVSWLRADRMAPRSESAGCMEFKCVVSSVTTSQATKQRANHSPPQTTTRITTIRGRRRRGFSKFDSAWNLANMTRLQNVVWAEYNLYRIAINLSPYMELRPYICRQLTKLSPFPPLRSYRCKREKRYSTSPHNSNKLDHHHYSSSSLFVIGS